MSSQVSRRQVLQWGIGGAAASLFIASCGDDDDTTAAEPAGATDTTGAGGTDTTQTEALRVRTSRSSSGLGAGMAFGMQDYGQVGNLEIDMEVLSPTDAENALLNGQMDMVLFGFLSLVRAHLAGKDNVVMFAPSFASHSSIFQGPDGTATSLADLQGANLGVLPRVSAQYNDLVQIAAEQDIDLESAFNLTLGDPQLQQGLFLQGELDAFCPFEPIATRLIANEEASEVFSFSAEWERMFGVPMMSIGWVADKDWLEETGGADRIRRANADAVNAMLEGPAEFEKHAEIYGLETPESLELLSERVSKLLTPEWNDDIIENLQTRLDRGVEQGIIEEAVDIERLIVT